MAVGGRGGVTSSVDALTTVISLPGSVLHLWSGTISHSRSKITTDSGQSGEEIIKRKQSLSEGRPLKGNVECVGNDSGIHVSLLACS